MNGPDSFPICRPSFIIFFSHCFTSSSSSSNRNRFFPFCFYKFQTMSAPIKKTTSMTDITFDLGGGGSIHDRLPASPAPPTKPISQQLMSPRNHRRHSIDVQENANFLRDCSLCSRPLVPGRDIYMYRGDRGFCSDECRQQQMKQDERREKCSLASKKAAAKAAAVVSSSAAVVPPQISGKGETVAAS